MDYMISHESNGYFKIDDLINKKWLRTIKSSELGKFEGTKKYLSTSSIEGDKIVNIESEISFDERPSRASMKPICSSVWFAKMKNTIKVLLADQEIENDFVLSTGFYGLLPTSEIITSEWLYHVLLSEPFNKQRDKLSEGSSMSGIKDFQLGELTIPLLADNKHQEMWSNVFTKMRTFTRIMDSQLEEITKLKTTLLISLFI